MLNELYANPRAEGKGIQCLILYPMNALVNDQVDRLYDWLKGQSGLKLFHFTSETLENKKAADNEGIPDWEPCRIRTRQQARGLEDREGKILRINDPAYGRVPDILVTNYSMLEYMLCRPQDGVFFGNGLRILILDEAHLYTGTLAAEITLLLRRLLDRCGLSSGQVLQIATSATIGTGAAGELESFASQLFTKRESSIRVIRGQSHRIKFPAAAPPAVQTTVNEIVNHQWLYHPTLTVDDEGNQLLARDEAQCTTLVEDLSLLVSNEAVDKALQAADQYPARLLSIALASAPLLHQAESLLWERKHLPLRDLARELWKREDDAAIRATITILQMGATARNEAHSYPLLPHRLHLLARPTDGLIVCLNSECTREAHVKLPGLGCVSAGYMDHCPHCQSVTLSLFRCGNCGEAVLAGNEFGSRLLPVAPFDFTGHKHFFTLSSLEGRDQLTIDPETGRIGGVNGKGPRVSAITECPRCKTEKWHPQPFVSSEQLTLTILAESALTELPEYPTNHRKWLPAGGRRMLAFSDSRQEAARLGPRLTLQHEIQLIRAALARTAADNPPVDDSSIQFLKDEIEGYEQKLQMPGITPAMQQKIETKLDNSRQELEAQMVGGAIEEWRDRLQKEPAIQQLMDAEAAKSQQVEGWAKKTQQTWDENYQRVKLNLAWMIGRELAKPIRRSVTVETLGLLEVTYPGLQQIPPPPVLGSLPSAACEAFEKCWTTYLAAICDSLRRDGGITLGSDEADKEYPFGNELIGRWCTQETTTGAWLIRMLSARRQTFTAEVLRRCGLVEERVQEVARELLQQTFSLLHANANDKIQWLRAEPRLSNNGPVAAVQLIFTQLGLRAPATLFRCENTGQVWARSVHGCAPEPGCHQLQPISATELDREGRGARQRREMKESPVFSIGLWAEEHSAQLSPKENRRLQELFKVGARNILSSTTTLELGIDIGGLNAVLMSNVPPGKANYLQRAGRAGRRADGSSVVITYARSRPFDREVFHRIGDYLSGTLRRPRVLLERSRVVKRHAHAFLLGEFFKTVYPPGTRVGAMNAFGNMGRFCGEVLPSKWNRGESKPGVPSFRPDWQPAVETAWWNQSKLGVGLEEHFLDFLSWVRNGGKTIWVPRLANLFQNTPLSETLEDWVTLLDSVISAFKDAVRNWKQEYQALLQAWKSVSETASQARAQSNMLRYQMSALYETTVIEALADKQFLPRYGFPIGLQKLRVIIPDENNKTRIREEDQFRLERPGLLALREYVPGSQLLVGGKLITSRGLLKHWTGADLDSALGLRGLYATCLNGHFYYEIAQPLSTCPICDKQAKQTPQQFLIPRYGFSSAAWLVPRRSIEVERVGSVERATITFARNKSAALEERQSYAGIVGINAQYSEEGELLVYNNGAVWPDEDDDTSQPVAMGLGFAICLKCGYADSESRSGQGRTDLPSRFSSHARLTAANKFFPCWQEGEAPILRNQTLAARETTDVLMLSFSAHRADLARDEALVWTIAHGLQIAGARILELDTRELGVMVTGTAEGFGAVIYDNTPGGAGHVRELLDLERFWLEETCRILYLNEERHVRCETACLDCLLTFDAQQAMGKGLLKRRTTYETLTNLLANPESERGDKESAHPKILAIEQPPQLTNEERLALAQMRNARKRLPGISK